MTATGRVTIVEGLVIRPGDTFIVRINPAAFSNDLGAAAEASTEYAGWLQEELHQLLPDVRGVVLVVPGDIAVQRGPELDDPARPLVDLAPLPKARAFDLGPLPDPEGASQ